MAGVYYTLAYIGDMSETVGARKYSDAEINRILDELKGDGFKNNPLRQVYEMETQELSKLRDSMIEQGLSKKEIAETLNEARRNLGIEYKNATPQPLREYIYEINQNRYGDPLGPTMEYFSQKGRTYPKIIESALRPHSDIDSLLLGFEKWLRRQ